MNERPAVDRLREAMRNAELDVLEQAADEIGRNAIEAALAEPPPPVPAPQPMAHTLIEEERQRLLDAALADAIETVARHRMRLGRRVCSRPDATVTRLIYEALRGMVDATGGVDNDPSFQ
jgi:hypothetical protein